MLKSAQKYQHFKGKKTHNTFKCFFFLFKKVLITIMIIIIVMIIIIIIIIIIIVNCINILDWLQNFASNYINIR